MVTSYRQIPSLPAVIALNGTEEYEAVQDGVSVRIATHQIFDYFQTLPSNQLTFSAPLQRVQNNVVLNTVPVGQGGTGQTVLNSMGLLFGQGTSPVGVMSPGQTGQILVGVTGSPPAWQQGGNSFTTTFSAGTTGFTPSVPTTGAIVLSGILNLASGGTGADLSATGGAAQVLRQSAVGAPVTVGQLVAGDLGNGTTGTGLIVLQTSPALLGAPTAPTPTPSTDSSTQIATTAFVQGAVSGFLPLSGGTLTGTLHALNADFKNTITVFGPAGVNSGVITHDNTNLAVRAGTGGALNLGSNNANVAFLDGSGFNPSVTKVGSLGRAAFIWNGVHTMNTTLYGSASGSTVLLPSATASGTITFPAATGTVALLTNIPSSLPPSGAASGDLAGTYPGPTIKTSVNLLGSPTTTTQLPAVNNTTIATTAYVNTAIAAAASGTVTSVAVASINGLAGTVDFPTTAAVISLSTTVTGMLKGDGTSILVAVAGTDYLSPSGAAGLYLPLAGGTLTGQLNSTTTLVGASTPALNIQQTWNNAATLFTGVNINVTDTASNVNSSLFVLTVGGANRFFVNKAGSAVATANVIGGAASGIGWTTRSWLFSPADGQIRLSNQAQTDFARLQFGGTTNAFPAIKRALTALNFVLADDTGDASVTFATQVAGTNNTTGATTAFVATAVASAVGGATPTGPAGGMLSGTYPNPNIKPSVTNGQIMTTVGGVSVWATPSGGGSVTSVSVVSANGLAGTVATPTVTPAITLSTTITGMLKGDGTAISAAVAGTDYLTPAGAGTLYLPLVGGTLTGPGDLTVAGVSTLQGVVGVGVTASNVSLYVNKALTGNTSMFGVRSSGGIQSDVTTSATYFYSQASTVAAAFTLGSLAHFSAVQSTIGAGSTVTTQYGFLANATLIGATNNYGFYGSIPTGTNNWNLYATGTASNYMAGALGIGVASLTGYNLYVNRSLTGATSVYGIRSSPTAASDVTVGVHSFYSAPSTAAAAFTVTSAIGYRAEQGTIGAGSAITNQYGYYAGSTLIGATGNNIGFYSAIPAGTNRYNFYGAGTAQNLFNGTTALAGGATAPTMTVGDNTTNVATTAFVTTAIAALPAAPTTLPPSGPAAGDLAGTYPNPTIKASVGLTGAPTSSTAALNTNTTQIATTAFVQQELVSDLAAYLPLAGGTLTGGLNGTTAAFSGGLTGVTGTFSSHITSTGGNVTASGGLVVVDRVGDAAAAQLDIASDVALQARINLRTGALGRWFIEKEASAETGSNAGSNLLITPRDDAGGNTIGTALNITRATMATKFGGQMTIVTGTAGTVVDALIVSSNASSAAGASARMYLTTGTTSARGVYVEGINVGGGANAHDMVLGTNSGSAVPVERMRISSTGTITLLGALTGTSGTFSGPVTASYAQLSTSAPGLLMGHTAAINVIAYGVVVTPHVQVTSSAGGADPLISLQRYSASTNGPIFNASLSHGATLGAHVVVANGDNLGMVNFNGSDGVKFVEGASIRATVDGVPGLDDMPTRIAFFTSPDGAAAPTEAMRIGSNNFVGIGTSAVTTLTALHVRGTGFTGANPSVSTGLGATVYVQNNTTVAGDGGMVMFGCNAGPFAGLKGYANAGSSGDLVVVTRRISTDTTMTEGARFLQAGGLSLAGPLSGTTDTMTGAIKAMSATTIPAGGTAGAGFMHSAAANFGYFFGSGLPTLAAARGSIYLRSDGGGPYVNTDSATTWVALDSGGSPTAIPQNIQATDYTLVAGDAGKHIYHAAGTASCIYTVPANATVAYGIGTTLTFINDSVNIITLTVTTDALAWSPGVQVGSRTLGQQGVATMIKVTATRWIISGTGLA